MHYKKLSYKYTKMAMLFHWLSAILFFLAFYFGYTMVRMPFTPQKLEYMSWHKWAGVTIFLIVVLRLIWRMFHRPPAYFKKMSPIQARLASFGHFLLYFLLLCLPAVGYLMSQAKGYPIVYFGYIQLPTIMPVDLLWGKRLGLLHEILAYALIVLVIGHILMALKHHFLDRDRLLSRMNPFSK